MARSKRPDATRVANAYPDALSRPQERVLQGEDEVDGLSSLQRLLQPVRSPAVYIAPIVRRRLLERPRQQLLFQPLRRTAKPPSSPVRLSRDLWYRGRAFFCLRRAQRREVLFAKGRGGARAYKRGRARRSVTSNYGCR